MGKDSSISWCHHTHNRWWGCEKISPGCANCYAAELDKRLGGDNWKVGGPRRWFGAAHLDEPRKWNAAAKRAGVRERVFCGSMMDIAEQHRDREVADRQESLRLSLWDLILATYSLDWLLLTKRPENLVDVLPWGERGAFAAPFRNVWLGTTCEDQEHADKRIPRLKAADAALRFLSCEPLLGSIDLREHIMGYQDDDVAGGRYVRLPHRTPYIVQEKAIHWVIAGCESGRKARPCEVDWLRDLRDQCEEAGVPFFLKQANAHHGGMVQNELHMLGHAVDAGPGSHAKRGGVIELPYLDGVQHAAVPEAPAARAA